MGNTGNKIKDLEKRVDYLEKFLDLMNKALVRLEDSIASQKEILEFDPEKDEYENR